jgi:hypothetical protein
MSIASGGGRELGPDRKQIGHWGQNSVSGPLRASAGPKRIEQLSMG